MADPKKKDNAKIPVPTGGRRAVAKEAVALNIVPFVISPEHWLHKALLVDVNYQLREGKKDPEKTYPVLNFVFRHIDHLKSPNDARVPMEIVTEWPITGDDAATVNKRLNWQDNRLAQLYNCFMGDNAHQNIALGEGEHGDPAAWEAFYANLADTFNKGKNGNPIYKDENGNPYPIWLTLTYDPSGNTQLPFGNFIHLVRGAEPSYLRMRDKNEYIKADSKKSSKAGRSEMSGGGDLPPITEGKIEGWG